MDGYKLYPLILVAKSADTSCIAISRYKVDDIRCIGEKLKKVSIQIVLDNDDYILNSHYFFVQTLTFSLVSNNSTCELNDG